MAFVHHTMLTAENLRGLPSKQLHTNVEPHYSPRSRAAPLCGVGGLVGVYSRPVIGALFCPISGFRYCYTSTVREIKNRFLGLSAFSQPGDLRSQI